MKKDFKDIKQTSLFGDDVPFYKAKKKAEVKEDVFDKRNTLNDLTGKQWLERLNSFIYSDNQNSNSVDKKLENEHPESDSYSEFEFFITFFTKQGMSVLDPFAGVGAAAKACEKSGRICTAIELIEKWHCIASTRLNSLEKNEWSKKQILINGDCIEEMSKLENDSFDFVITSPPHCCFKDSKSYNFLKLAGGIAEEENSKKDIGSISDYNEYINILADVVFKECGRLLKPEKYMCIIVSDFRNGPEFMSMHADLINKMHHGKIDCEHELLLQGVKLILDDKKALPYGYPYMYVENIHHRYALIFKKTKRLRQIEIS